MLHSLELIQLQLRTNQQATAVQEMLFLCFFFTSQQFRKFASFLFIFYKFKFRVKPWNIFGPGSWCGFICMLI